LGRGCFFRKPRIIRSSSSPPRSPSARWVAGSTESIEFSSKERLADIFDSAYCCSAGSAAGGGLTSGMCSRSSSSPPRSWPDFGTPHGQKLGVTRPAGSLPITADGGGGSHGQSLLRPSSSGARSRIITQSHQGRPSFGARNRRMANLAIITAWRGVTAFLWPSAWPRPDVGIAIAIMNWGTPRREISGSTRALKSAGERGG